MNTLSRTSMRRVVCATVSLSMLLQPLVGGAAQLNLVKTPLFVTPPIPPLVMLDISKDQQLHKKAYNDYSDLDGDGKLETTYKHSIDYYGYFDSYKCYDYVGGNALEGLSHYAPTSWTADKYCDGTKWSGNFLNWATMTRMDSVRKLLFGGLRRQDRDPSSGSWSYGSTALLERSNLPSDAHAFAKWYGGSDVNRLSPFGVQTTPTTAGTAVAPVITTAAVNVQVTASNQVTFTNIPDAFANKLSPGDQITAYAYAREPSPSVINNPVTGTVNGIPNQPCVISGRMVGKTAGSNPTIILWVDVGGTFVKLKFPTTPPDPPGTLPVAEIGGTETGAGPTNCETPSLASTNQWVFENLSSTGISICNVTPGTTSGAGQFSHTNQFTPRMRMVKGNYELWGANERFQCYWHDEKSNLQGGFLPGPQQPSSNGNQYSLSGLSASAENPANSTGRIFASGGGSIERRSLGFGVDAGEYRVMVEACRNDFFPATATTGFKTTEKCKAYGQVDGSGKPFYKPIGLLQVYGDDGRINFGLMTGSYSKNTSGGVLRKNTGALSDEIDAATGVFKTAPPNGSIVGTLSRLRMYGYDYNVGTYIGADGNCTYQLTSSQLVDNMCRTWGNPMSEIYAESLRYFAGATAPTAAFQTTADATLFPASGIYPAMSTATWPNPNNVLTNANYCAPLNILAFNSSVSSKDHDQVSDPFNGAIAAWANPKTATTFVGNKEGLGSGKYFYGQDSATPAADRGLCSAKPPGGGGVALGDVQGLCPEAPSLNGTYLMAGLAYAAKTNRIRTDLTVPATDKTSLKVTTYGISLATNVPRIEIPVPGGATGQKVVIQPVYRLDRTLLGGGIGAGAIVDVKIVSQSADGTRGRIYVNWEDSEQGGDYDQDVWGVIDYRFSGANLLVTTDVVAASTANPQGFGYVISGTTQDGPHFHSGIYNFNYTDPTIINVTNAAGTVLNGAAGIINASGGCRNCSAADVPTTATYTISTSGSAQALNDPLWYAAKYGGFTDSGNNGLSPIPDLVTEWDVVNNATGAPGSDGIPDNYYSVSNPLGLETALDKLFISILQTSAASAVAANSSKLNTSTRIYQAVFNPSDWSGKILAFGVNATTGIPNTTADWDGGQKSLNATTITPGARKILTFNKGVSATNPRGIPFAWPSNPAAPLSSELSLAQITALNTNPGTNTGDAQGQKRLDYLRGDASNEGLSVTNFRRRPTTKLGDIINSNPNFVGPPSAGHPDASYKAFAANSINSNRKPMLYVGANDGMLHGFEAGLTGAPGAELLAYVPSPVYRNLSKLTSRTYSHEYFVDGSPVVEDAFIGSAWKTVLVGGLNRGGQGVYALDVTDPAGFAGNTGSLVMWEFTDADDPDLGYTFGTPLIRKMSNGKWAAIVSGGYNNSQGATQDAAEVPCASGLGTVAAPYLPAGCSTSLTGKGFIFIVYLDGPTGTNGTWQLGTDYFKVATSTGDIGTPNGLATPLAADMNGDGMVDLIYAGDLLGGLWKFDVSGAATTWMSASSRLKLFDAIDAAGNAQPITSGVEAVRHPSGNGIMVSFGTGKYLETIDINPPGPAYKTQSIYGIWDQGATVVGRTNLMPQLLQPGITNIVTNPDGSVSRITTRHQPNYTTGSRPNPLWDGSTSLADRIGSTSTKTTDLADQRGWFLDLFNGVTPDPVTGERIIFAPFVKNGVVFYSSLWPLDNACLGSTAGDNITLMISTGARPDASVFDLTGDQQVNASDMVTVGIDSSGKDIKVAVSSKRIDGGSAQPPTLVSKGSVDIGYQNTTSGNLATGVYSFGRGPGRVSWREILY